ADKIDDDVGAELVTVFGREARYTDNRINVFRIDVKNGDRLAARDASGEARGVLLGIARREAEKVVYDDVDRSADGVSLEIGVVHRLGENSLPGERRISVY